MKRHKNQQDFKIVYPHFVKSKYCFAHEVVDRVSETQIQ